MPRVSRDGAPLTRTTGNRTAARTTLAVIAAEAGVSLPTVSKVVNGRPDVAADTRARVERLLDEYQYTRVGTGRQRRSGLIDLVFSGLDSPWAVEILRGVEEWGASHETGVAVSAVRHGNARPASWTSALASHDTDGVIVVISEETGRKIDSTQIADLGRARRVTSNKDETTVVEGHGKESEIQGPDQLLVGTERRHNLSGMLGAEPRTKDRATDDLGC